MRLHGSESMDDGWVGRGDAGAMGILVAGHQGADQTSVSAGAHSRISRAVSRRPPRAGAAQDGLDASGSRGRPRALAPAGLSRSHTLGRRCPAQSRAHLLRTYALETLAEKLYAK